MQLLEEAALTLDHVPAEQAVDTPPVQKLPAMQPLHVSFDVVLPPLHVYPASTAQEEEQPSPDTVFPSSQPSLPPRLLSPQTATQELEEVEPAEEKVAAGQLVQADAPDRE